MEVFVLIRWTLLIVGLWFLLPVASGQAQQTAPPKAPEPAADATPLPALEVTAKKDAKKKAAAKKPAAAKPVAAKKAPATQPEPDAPKQAEVGSGPGTGTGPVEGYVATETTTGAKSDTPLRQIPQSISVVGQEQMRDQGVKNWQEALRYMPGVVADGYGIDSRADTAFVRGTEASEFLDGLKRTFNYYVFSYRIDPYFMERIEVLRGPPSVLYGQAPVGGIVNSVSKRPQQTASREVTVEYGTNDYKQVKTDLTGPLTQDGRWSYRLVGALRDADTQVDYVPDDHVALSPSLTFRPQASTSITLLGHYQDDETGSTQQFLPQQGTRFPTKSGFIPSSRFVGEPEDRYDTTTKSVSLFVDHKFDDAVRLRHNSRYLKIHNVYNSFYPNIFSGPEPGNPFYPYQDADERLIKRVASVGDADTQSYSTDTNLEVKVATGPLQHKFIGGVDYTNFRSQQESGQTVDDTLFDVFNPVYGLPHNFQNGLDYVPIDSITDQRVTQTGLYLQDQMRLGNWIGVVGVRHDWLHEDTTNFFPLEAPGDQYALVDQKNEATTYRAGLMYEFNFGLTPYVSYAQSFVPVIGRRAGGGAFDPQQGEMYEAGFKYQPPGLPFMINSAVFDITESNRLAPGPGDTSIQTGEVTIRGFEFEATGNVTANIKTIASYSFTDAVYSGTDRPGIRVESVPQHLASFWALYSFDTGWLKGWSTGAGVRYIGSSYDGLDIVKTPPVGLVDATIAYDTKDWRWSINASNLEDKEYLSTCFSYGRFDCFVGARRTITTGLTYRF